MNRLWVRFLPEGPKISCSFYSLRFGRIVYMKTKTLSDHVGIVVSCACLFHCLALPALLLLFQTEIVHTEEWLHTLLLGVTVLVSGHAFWHGFKHHCKHIVWMLGGLGVLTMGVALMSPHELETILTSIGASVVVIAHLLNIKHRNCCTSH